jgi:hypothetical protein
MAGPCMLAVTKLRESKGQAALKYRNEAWPVIN